MKKLPAPQPDRESYRKHRRDVNRQIIFPILLVTVLGIGLAVFTGYAATVNNPDVSLWADISIIWLVIPVMLFALVILALTIGMVYGLNRLLKISPHYTGLAQSYVLWFYTQVTNWAGRLVRPLISIKTWLGLLLNQKG